MSAPKKILVIDDDEAVFDYLQQKIGYLYDLVTTKNPSLALDTAIRVVPDLILCDIDMPDISGGELSVQFSECKHTCHIPFAYLTSFVSPREVREMRGNVGGRHGIAKATPAPEMIEMIEMMLK
jgi:CheY-like chemotaxis protein